MAKSIQCKAICNTRNGYCAAPYVYNSIAEAVRDVKKSWYFAYRIFSMDDKLLRRGFC